MPLDAVVPVLARDGPVLEARPVAEVLLLVLDRALLGLLLGGGAAVEAVAGLGLGLGLGDEQTVQLVGGGAGTAAGRVNTHCQPP